MIHVALTLKVVEPSPLSTAWTELHEYPPIATSGDGKPLAGLSIVRVRTLPALPDVGEIAWTAGAALYSNVGIPDAVRALPSWGVCTLAATTPAVAAVDVVQQSCVAF